MALDFPSSPTDGQIYNNYYYDSANSVWQTLGSKQGTPADFSNTATGTFSEGGIDYKCVIFKSSGSNLVITRGGLIEYLVVGGGGSGAAGLAGHGGGGAGEVVTNLFETINTFYLPAGTYPITVGAGGASVNSNVPGLPGNDSSIGSVLVAKRGGGGGRGTATGFPDVAANVMGGSGGGGGLGVIQSQTQPQAGVNQTSGSLTRFGNRGGNNLSDSTRTGGGGGGAGAPGTDGGAGTGAGGAGKIVNIIPASLATSQSVGEVSGSDVYWGGGGSGGQATAIVVAGGIGGGGAGGSGIGPTAGSDGDPNTGGGGGGQSQSNTAISGAGGSGVVIVRVRTN